MERRWKVLVEAQGPWKHIASWSLRQGQGAVWNREPQKEWQGFWHGHVSSGATYGVEEEWNRLRMEE